MCRFCLNSTQVSTSPRSPRMLGVVEKSTVRMPQARCRWCTQQYTAVCWLMMIYCCTVYKVGNWQLCTHYTLKVREREREISQTACLCPQFWLKAPNCPRVKLKTGQNVFMAAVVAPTHVSHHDSTRAAVSTTALGACAVRVWESKKDPSERSLTNSGEDFDRLDAIP